MKVSNCFTVAVHILCLLSLHEGKVLTLERIAKSVDTDPVVIRRIIGKLKKADLISIVPAIGGAYLLKRAEEITLLDVYRAVEAVGESNASRCNELPNQNDSVGSNIEFVLGWILRRAQSAMEQVLTEITMEELIEDLAKKEGNVIFNPYLTPEEKQ